jgi:hypothetical protein
MNELAQLKNDPSNFVTCDICGQPVFRGSALWVYDYPDKPPKPIHMSHVKRLGNKRGPHH